MGDVLFENTIDGVRELKSTFNTLGFYFPHKYIHMAEVQKNPTMPVHAKTKFDRLVYLLPDDSMVARASLTEDGIAAMKEAQPGRFYVPSGKITLRDGNALPGMADVYFRLRADHVAKTRTMAGAKLSLDAFEETVAFFSNQYEHGIHNGIDVSEYGFLSKHEIELDSKRSLDRLLATVVESCRLGLPDKI